MLNPSSIRRRWRENVSLRHFQNCNMLIINHFRNYGVEDESGRSRNAGRLGTDPRERPPTLKIRIVSPIYVPCLDGFSNGGRATLGSPLRRLRERPCCSVPG